MARYFAVALSSQKTTHLVDNLNVVENKFQIVRNFDQPNRRIVKPGSHLCDKHEHNHKLKKNRA